MALAKRNEGAKVNSDINVTPMVDVMLVLLIIFMVVTPMLQKGVSVDLGQHDRFTRPPAGVDYDSECKSDRVERRKLRWMPVTLAFLN